MDLNTRYIAVYAELNAAVVHEMELLDQADHVTELNARRELLSNYGLACAKTFDLMRQLDELQAEMRKQKPATILDRIFRKKK